MSQPAEQPVPLGGLAAEVSRDSILALLIGRPPDCLDDPERQVLVEQLVAGITAEVVAVTGRDPIAEQRDLAVWAIVLGAAASLEAALFPENIGIGDTGRAEVLRTQYLGVLAGLQRRVTAEMTPLNYSGVISTASDRWLV